MAISLVDFKLSEGRDCAFKVLHCTINTYTLSGTTVSTPMLSLPSPVTAPVQAMLYLLWATLVASWQVGHPPTLSAQTGLSKIYIYLYPSPVQIPLCFPVAFRIKHKWGPVPASPHLPSGPSPWNFWFHEGTICFLSPLGLYTCCFFSLERSSLAPLFWPTPSRFLLGVTCLSIPSVPTMFLCHIHPHYST